MGKHLNKQQARLQRRVSEHQRTTTRQQQHNFKPNATGPTHFQHMPGSMNPKKG